MRNLGQYEEGSSQQQQKKRFRTTAMMLGRVPAVDASERDMSRENEKPMPSDPENFEDSAERSSHRSTGRGAARNMLV